MTKPQESQSKQRQTNPTGQWQKSEIQKKTKNNQGNQEAKIQGVHRKRTELRHTGNMTNWQRNSQTQTQTDKLITQELLLKLKP